MAPIHQGGGLPAVISAYAGLAATMGKKAF